MQKYLVVVLCLLVPLTASCALKEVRSKAKFGPEFRHRGSNRTNSDRWTAQQGIEFEWDKGISTGLTYRRRDTDDGGGDNDNGVWLEVSFPLWKAEKRPDAVTKRIAELERRLAELEGRLQEQEKTPHAG
jgi:hypothetical protein